MSDPWLSVVVPTIGRDALFNTLESISEQPGGPGVEVLVVADTFGGLTRDLAHARARLDTTRFKWLEHDAGQHCVGQPQRSFGAKQAQAPYVWFTQDDNVSPRGGLAAIRDAIRAQERPRPLFFRFLSAWRETIWRVPILAVGNIDADCLVFPRELAREVEWGLRYEGDFDAASEAYRLVEGDVAWCDAIVSIARPNRGHLWWMD